MISVTEACAKMKVPFIQAVASDVSTAFTAIAPPFRRLYSACWPGSSVTASPPVSGAMATEPSTSVVYMARSPS